MLTAEERKVKSSIINNKSVNPEFGYLPLNCITTFIRG